MEVTTTALTAAIGKLTDAINAHTSAVQANTQALNALTSVQQEIEKELQPAAQSATLHMTDHKGNPMPLTLQVNGPGGSVAPPAAGSPAGHGFQEWDGLNGTCNQVAPIGPMSYQSDNPAACSVDANGNLTAVSAGTANVTATDTGNNLSATDQITVVDKAQSATLNAVANAATRQIAKPSPIAKK